MPDTIAGALQARHNIDANGSLSINVPLLTPHAKAVPDLSLAYHSAANAPSTLGLGWVLKGAPMIERVPATIAQDGFRGVVNYDNNDRFALDGQRIMNIGGNEYRFEIEDWSKITAHGSDASNPDYWTQHLPDGSTRTFGATTDSNIKALGKNSTRVWAVSESKDSFSNLITYSYNNDTANGAYYLTNITYGGNKSLSMNNQRQISLAYEDRTDKTTRYLGGYKIHSNKRLATITASVQSKVTNKYQLNYDTSPLTKVSRLASVTLSDATGSSVLPLSFGWVNANPAVFDETKQLGTIAATTKAEIIPLDVNASGRSDVVLVSERYESSLGSNGLHLSVHLADGRGNISTSPAPGSGPTGLLYPTQLLALDMNGDGRTDLVHIFKSPVKNTHAITVLLSTPDGYKKQETMDFTPESLEGTFHTGDFEGNGRIGLAYVYQVYDPSESFRLKVVQLTSNGSKFTPLAPVSGPGGATLKDSHLVVGDLNGKGADDVFLITPAMNGSTRYPAINFFESVDAKLTYRSGSSFRNVAANIPFTTSTSFMGFSADGDGKTSILVVSRNTNGYLVLQLLRSTGPSLIADPQPTVTSTLYNGNLTVNRVSSTSTVDLINSFDGLSGPQLGVLRFDGEKFYAIDGVLQPKSVSQGSTVRWADLNGVGRANCLLGTYNVSSGNLSVYSMPCSVSQPIDYISSYDNNIGALTSITYASLSDPDTYTTSGAASNYAPAFVNAMSRGVASSIALTASSSQTAPRNRTELVHYPSFVTRQVSTRPLASKPDVKEEATYKYKNALVTFDGRGWLGFETITKVSDPVGLSQTSSYFQRFPLIGQISATTTSDKASGKSIQVNTFPWTSVAMNGNKTHTPQLPSLKEVYYEGGTQAYEVTATMRYDGYSNITSRTIASTQPGVSSLSVESTYSNDTQRWVIGSKLTETVKQGSTTLKQSKHTYVPGTRVSKETSNWVTGNQWSTRTFEIDGAGNETSATGPGPAHQTFEYDETRTNVTTINTYTTQTNFLTEKATYDTIHGKPLTTTEPNGFVKSYKYDILGRPTEISQGPSTSALKTTEKNTFQYTTKDGFAHTRLVLSGRDDADQSWSKMIAHTDGLYRVWEAAWSLPDNLESFVYSSTRYDGAGRAISTSRDYISGEQPVFSSFQYDPQSRLTRKQDPADGPGLSPTTTTYSYATKSGLIVATETRSDGSANNQVTTKTLSHLPNPDPVGGKIVVSCVTSQSDALGQVVQTQFDGLARPITITDPSGVYVTLGWDGISRQTKRVVVNGAGSGAKTINHFTTTYEDADSRITAKNELTGQTNVLKLDLANRPISQTTPEETITLSYDSGGQFTKGLLVKVTSSLGIEHTYDYDIRGHLTKSSLSLDGQTFPSTFQWTPAGQLSKTTNPDGSSLTQTFFRDGETPQKLTLADAGGTTRASATFSDTVNAFARPLTCVLGNGITSKSTYSSNGSPSSHTLTNSANTIVSRQTWKLESFGKIREHGVSQKGQESVNVFQYDPSGQLRSRSGGSSARSTALSYDKSGNISLKDGNNFINDGWQLSTVQNQQGAKAYTFKYSVDGNTTAKLDGSGKEVNTMTYNSHGRLTKLDGTTFVYDFGGRLIKATTSEGNVTYYPSPAYEVTKPAGGKTNNTSYIMYGYRRAALSSSVASDGKVESTTVYYFHADHLGNTIAASDGSGTMITSYEYDPLGTVTVDGPDVARYKFSGKEKFGNYYYFGARFYDPEIGRFLTVDTYPIDHNNVSPSTLNLYSFSRNDPINFIDVNGNVPWWHWIVDTALTVAGVAVSLIPIPGMSFLGGALLGAGISGFMTDISAEIFNNGEVSDKDWGIQLGLGAAFGLVSAGIGAAIDVVLPAGSALTAAASRSVTGMLSKAVIGKLAARFVTRVVLNTAAGAILGVGQQVVTNAINGDPLGKDLGTAAWTGAVSGAIFATAFEGVSFAGLKAKVWAGKKWGIYDVARAEFRAANGGSVTLRLSSPEGVVLTGYKSTSSALSNPSLSSVSNSLRRTMGEVPSVSSAVSSGAVSSPGLGRRIVPASEVTRL